MWCCISVRAALNVMTNVTTISRSTFSSFESAFNWNAVFLRLDSLGAEWGSLSVCLKHSFTSVTAVLLFKRRALMKTLRCSRKAQGLESRLFCQITVIAALIEKERRSTDHTATRFLKVMKRTDEDWEMLLKAQQKAGKQTLSQKDFVKDLIIMTNWGKLTCHHSYL